MAPRRRPLVALLAPLLLLPLLSVPAPAPANRCLWATAIISSFWALEVLPLAVTSLLPLVLYPALGVLPAAAVSTNYFKDKIVLFFGGLVVAAALESVELHRRMALRVLVAFGTKPPQLLLGFMSATAFLSMWMSNTATAAMMMPIAEGVLQQLEAAAAAAAAAAAPAAPSPAALQRVGKALMLAVAWSANIGGMATLTGTGPNLVLAGDFTDLYPAGPGLSFAHWLAFALPLAVAFLLCAWQLLVRAMLRHSRGLYDTDAAAAAIRMQYAALGPMSFRERLVLGDFAALAVLWITRDPKFIPGWGSLFERGFVSDGTVAALMAILLFALPAEKPRGCRPPARHLVGPTRASDPTLLDGQEPTSTAAVQLEAVPPPDANASAPAADAADAVATPPPRKRPLARCDGGGAPSEALVEWAVVARLLPWGVVLLLGGGFAVADACVASGLSAYVGESLVSLRTLPPALVAVLLMLIVSATTAVTSNVATASIFVPVVAGLADSCDVHPLRFMLPVTLTCSLAFVLPVSTPPNALAFSSGRLRVRDMVGLGVCMNLIGIALIALALHTTGELLFELGSVPAWAGNRSSL